MSTDKMDSSAVYALFEKLKQEITKSDSKEQNNSIPIDLSGVENKVNQSEERILLKLDELAQNASHPVLQKHQHRISIDIASSWVFIALISLSLLLLCAIGLTMSQRSKNAILKDNDLKYRYIKMQGETNHKELLNLETVFTYKRNNDSISAIRKQVETYERLVKEQAEKIERAKLNASEAERLQKEAESVKGR